MPIIINDFKWKQSEENVVIQVPLHNVHQSKVDIFTSPQYIKASFEAYFFEALLSNPVDITHSSCIKTPKEIIFDLKKVTQVMWDSLEIAKLTKKERAEIKNKFIELERERQQKEHESKLNKKSELKRIAVNEQIELDAKVRNRISEIKKNEETKALGDIDEWKKETEQSFKRKLPKSTQLYKKNNGNEKSTNEKQINVPKPRSTKSLQVLFTDREFPTPSRESRLDEENEFLRKQAEARRSAGFIDTDLRPEEKNPQYLLSKGNEFLKNNNYLGAISAFSFGIKLSPKYLDLYIARSEAQMAAGNFNRVVEDCTTALDLLKPPLPINLNERALCIGLRGMALFKIGLMKQGIAEIKASLKLKSSDELQNILETYEAEFEGVICKENRKTTEK